MEDMKAFFNYDMNLYKWREYCKRVEQYRLQYTMQVPCSQSVGLSYIHISIPVRDGEALIN